MAKLHTPSGGHSQQISCSPDDILVVFVRGAIRIDNFPHHLNELTSALIVQNSVELTGETIEINCLAIDGDGFFEQAPGGVIIEREPGSQYTVEGFSSNLRQLTIYGGDSRQQCRGR